MPINVVIIIIDIFGFMISRRPHIIVEIDSISDNHQLLVAPFRINDILVLKLPLIIKNIPSTMGISFSKKVGFKKRTIPNINDRVLLVI